MNRRQLASLSDKRLLARIQKLAGIERRATISMLLHINEIERRGLHLKLGYGSLFDYCTKRLGYSAPSAGRRIQSARCVRAYPRAYEMLERNEINLTSLSTIAGVLTKKNSRDLLKRISGKSKHEVEMIKAEYTIAVPIRDRVRAVCVPVREELPPSTNQSKTTLTGESDSKSVSFHTRVESKNDIKEKKSAFKIEKRLAVEFLATPEFMQKFEEVRGLLLHKFAGRPSFEQVFDVVLDLFLDRYSPVRRQKRREERTHDNKEKEIKSPRIPQNKTFRSRQREWGKRRPISAAVRDAIYISSEGKCTYVSADGRRCDSTVCLQIDHIVPVSRGGTNDPSNLRLLCAPHNRIEAERVLGTAWTMRGDP